MISQGAFFSELRRRHVFRVAGVYIVAAWVALQVADLGFESWGVPANALRYVWIAALLLFPVAIIFSWRYDITASGIVRTPPASGSEDLSLKVPDFIILLALALAAMVVMLQVRGISEDLTVGSVFLVMAVVSGLLLRGFLRQQTAA